MSDDDNTETLNVMTPKASVYEPASSFDIFITLKNIKIYGYGVKGNTSWRTAGKDQILYTIFLF